MNVTGEWLEKWSAVFLMWTASLVKHNKKHKNFWCTGQQTDEKMTAEVLQEILQLFEGRRNNFEANIRRHVRDQSPGSFLSRLLSASSSISSWTLFWSDWTLSLRTRLNTQDQNNTINTQCQYCQVLLTDKYYFTYSLYILLSDNIWLHYLPESGREVIWR